MRNKKGEASPIFKYIFAIVAGVLFISFFVGFAMQHKKQQETLEIGRITFGFDDLLTLLSTSADSSMAYPEQGFPSTVTLNLKGDKISSGGITKTTTKIIFSEAQIKGRQFYIWTKRWKMPFTIDSFFYISDGGTPIYLIYDADSEEIASELTDKFSGFPKTFKVEKYAESKLTAEELSAIRARSKDYAKIRFVLFTPKPVGLKGFTNAETVIIEPATIEGETDWNYGTVEYEDGESTYLGYEMLIGAIAAENQEAFENAREKAMKKLETMAKLYEEKTKQLERICPGQYTLIAQALRSIAADPTKGTIEQLVSKTQALKEMNREFEAGCPEVF